MKRVEFLDVAGSERFCDKVGLVASVKLVAEIFDVPFDGTRRDAELLGALLG